MPVYAVGSGSAGRFLLSADATYATAAAGGTFTTSVSTASHKVGQRLGFDVWESFMAFDLDGVVPPWETVTDAVLSVEATANLSTTDFTVRVGEYDWSTAVSSADWRTPAQLAALAVLCEQGTSSWPADGTIVTFPATAALEAAAAAHSVANDMLRMVVWSSRHQSGAGPVGNEYVDFAGPASGGVEPQLTITATPSMVSSAPEWLEIDGLVLDCPAWRVQDLSPLHNVNVRGSDRILPLGTGPGALAYPRRLTMTRYVLPLVVFGHRDPLGNAVAVSGRRTRLARNVRYLRDRLSPPASPAVTRDVEWHRGGGTIFTAKGHVESLEATGEGPQHAAFNLELSVPDPRWAVTGLNVGIW